jgi:TRAP-type uncharacterized transport system fused permease subunit
MNVSSSTKTLEYSIYKISIQWQSIYSPLPLHSIIHFRSTEQLYYFSYHIFTATQHQNNMIDTRLGLICLACLMYHMQILWNLEYRYQNIRIKAIGSFVRKIKEKNTSAELSWVQGNDGNHFAHTFYQNVPTFFQNKSL